MAYTLLLDAYANQRVAVLKNDKILVEQTSNLAHSDTFMELIHNTLMQAKIEIKDVNYIALNVGPGSFTGIRVALSIAKGFAFNSNIKFIVYSSFDLLDAKRNEISLINGFSNFVYVKADKMDCVSFESLNPNLNYVTNSSTVVEKGMKFGLNIRLCNEKSIERICKTNSNKLFNINEVEPLYLRKSQAEIQKEQKIGR